MKPSVSAASRALPWILLGLLGLPLSTTLGLPIKEKGLAGDFVKATRPTLSWDSWFDGSFASKYAAWHNENFGLRSTTIRVYNQEGRWLHGVARANNIEIGTDDVLYDLESIRASRGAAVPEAEIQALADRIVQLERTLDARGISLVVGLAPGKATYWPGNVPPRFGPTRRFHHRLDPALREAPAHRPLAALPEDGHALEPLRRGPGVGRPRGPRGAATRHRHAQPDVGCGAGRGDSSDPG
jgi:hypothetical protein